VRDKENLRKEPFDSAQGDSSFQDFHLKWRSALDGIEFGHRLRAASDYNFIS
jgi:hypothetical protein